MIAIGAWKQRYVLTPKLSLYPRLSTGWWRIMAWLLLVLNAITKDDKGLLLWLDRAQAFCFAFMLVIAANMRVGGCTLDGFRTVRLGLIAFGAWKQRYVLTPKLSLYPRLSTGWWRIMAWLLLVLNAITKDDKGLLLWLDRAQAFCFAFMLVIAANMRVGGCTLDGFRTERLVLIAFGAWKQRYVFTPKLSLYLRFCTVWWCVMAWHGFY